MPYIANAERFWLEEVLEPLLSAIRGNEVSSGELNFILTKVLSSFLDKDKGNGPGYSDFNSAIGALECAKLELYRRMVAPYEDEKKEDNGDVYPNFTKDTP